MKKLTTFLVGLFAVITVYSQSPQKISYQAVIRNTNNQLVVNQSVGMKISILQGSPTGTLVYTETKTVSTNINGLASFEVGGNTAFEQINWANGPYFLKTETDPTGGANYTITGATELLSVPYALYALSTPPVSGSKWTESGANIYRLDGNVGIGTSSPSFKLDVLHGGSTGIRAKSTAGYSTIDVDAFNGDAAIRFANNGTIKWFLNTPSNNFTIGEYGVGSKFFIAASTGYVGIGSTSPTRKLEVQGNSNVTAGVFYSKTNYSGNSDVVAVEGSSVPNNGWGIGGRFEGGYMGALGLITTTSYSGTCYGVYGSSQGSAGTRYGGYFTANTSGASQNCGVYATASLATTNYAGYFSGNVTVTGTFSNPSDILLKKNVLQLNGALSKISLLKPSVYEYDNDNYKFMNMPTGKQVGFIAQELEEVFPELVFNNVHPGSDPKIETEQYNEVSYKSINYIGLIPVLVKGMQEQQEIIDKQQTTIEQLIKRIEALEIKGKSE